MLLVRNWAAPISMHVPGGVRPCLDGRGGWKCWVDAFVIEREGCWGIGVMVRSWDGGFMQAFSSRFGGLIPPRLTQAMALREGLKWIIYNLWNYGIVLSDVQQVFFAMQTAHED